MANEQLPAQLTQNQNEQLPEQLTRNQYVANGTDDTFTYSFYIPESKDLSVILTIDGEDFPQLLDTNYIVTGAASTDGGTIVFQSGFVPENNTIVTIIRDVPASYDFNFAAPKRITGQNLDNAFIADILLAQQSLTQFLFQSIKYSATTYFPTLEAVDPTVVPRLELGDVWIGGAFGNVTKVNLPEGAECSTLRTDLANENEGTDGSRMVGYFDSQTEEGMTVHDALDDVLANPISGTFSLQSAKYLKSDNSLNIQQLNFKSVNISDITKIITSPFVAGTGNGSNIGATAPTSGSYAVYLLIGGSGSSRTSDIGTCALADTPVIPPAFQSKYLIGYLVYGFDSIQFDNQLTFPNLSPLQSSPAPTDNNFPLNLPSRESNVVQVGSIDLSSAFGFDFYQCFLECSYTMIGLSNTAGTPPVYVAITFLITQGDTTPSVGDLQSSPFGYSTVDTQLLTTTQAYPIFMSTLLPAYKDDYICKVWAQLFAADAGVPMTVTAIDVEGAFSCRVRSIYLDLINA